MTKQITANLSISFKWWLRPYLKALVIFCTLTGKKPDEDKLSKVIRSGMIPKVELCDRAS